MSLFKQLFVAICLLLLVNFTGSFLLGVEGSREQQVNQLRAHAQDAATALGLSLSAHVDDPAMMELMVSSIFDSGYFERIRVYAGDGERVLVERTGMPVVSEVPAWFVRLIALEPAQGDAIVSDGWRQAARVEVISHPLFAIGKLWQAALGNLLWLALSGALCLALGVLLLKRQLRPLDYMVEQSNAIARREFLSVAELPRTPEFARVVRAMNQMVEKLKALFAEEAARTEKLRAEAYQDNLTGLANRRYFDMQLQARLGQDEQAGQGYLLLIQLADLAGLNLRLGGERVDQLLKAVAGQLQQVCQERFLLARNRGGEFIVLGSGLDRQDAEELAQSLAQAFEQLRLTAASDCQPLAHIGMTAFSADAQPAALYQALDQAVSQALTQSDCCWACAEQGAQPPVDERQRWHQLLDQALQQGRLQLYVQAVYRTQPSGQVLHHKVLARLLDEQGQAIAAGQFLPWLERFGWASRLDMAMLEQLLPRLAELAEPVALSLSGSTLRDAQALQALYQRLQAYTAQAHLLTLELDEDQLPDAATLEALTQRLRSLGYGLGLQHFGGRFSMIGNLARLGLVYLKVDGSYIRQIDQEGDKRLFIEALQRAANSIDLPLLAERVESAGEWAVLQEMGFAGGQGRYLGEPHAW